VTASPIRGTAAGTVAGISTPDPVTPLFASGLSNFVSPPALNLPPVPGLGIPPPSAIPIPSDLLSVGTDWSVSQGDDGAHPGTSLTANRRDRW
jgi:collagen type IV alpha